MIQDQQVAVRAIIDLESDEVHVYDCDQLAFSLTLEEAHALADDLLWHVRVRKAERGSKS